MTRPLSLLLVSLAASGCYLDRSFGPGGPGDGGPDAAIGDAGPIDATFDATVLVDSGPGDAGPDAR
ncbi:MAG: hypothetical protein K8H88_01825, partial [Sandaracinaceae bacterium]|nr:hypothetical protein [Sandaracinaceae bacterium]